MRTSLQTKIMTGFFILLIIPAEAVSFQSPLFTAEDMLSIVSFPRSSSPSCSPDGEFVVYGRVDVGDESNILARNPTGSLWLHPTNGGEARLLLAEGIAAERPVWSPDGRKLAFFEKDGEQWHLSYWDRNRGSSQRLGQPFPMRNYLTPQWNKRGDGIVTAIPVKPSETENPPRVQVVQNTDDRIPGDWFFVNKQQARLGVVDVSSGEVTLLVPNPVYLRSFDVSPDGSRLIYSVPDPATFAVVGKERNESFLLSLSGGSPRKISPSTGNRRFTWSPDGRHLLYIEKGRLMALSVDGGEPEPYIEKLEGPIGRPIWSGRGEHMVSLIPDRRLTDPEIEPPQPNMYSIARPFMDLYLISKEDGNRSILTEAFDDHVSQPLWSPDGEVVYFKTTNNASYDESLYAFSLSDRNLSLLTRGEESYNLVGATPGLLAFTAQSATQPADLWLIDVETRKKRKLTELNPQLEQFRFSRPELIHYHNADGDRLGALLYKPTGHQDGDRIPVVTYVYEKLTPAIHRFNARNQILLNHGYALLMPNVKIKVGEPGTSYVKCVVPAVNRVREMGFTNGRFGIWGGSFGGYATSFLITQTDIFSCAVSRATPPELFRNWASGRDRDSNNIVSGQARMGADPYDARERYIAQSAFFHLHRVNTPVLIMHGVKDYTILFGEGEMMFYALRQLGKEASFVIYNHGDHSLSRHSRSDTLDVNRRMLDWFDKYLKKN